MGRSADVPRTGGILAVDGDDTGCTILHVDMDAFYASVEVRRRPELHGKPVIVGGGTRGVVSAASYEARRYGVRSAMPTGHAVRLCPHAVVLPPDHAAYSEVSAQVMAILRDVTPSVEPLSLDEAFLDIASSMRLLGGPIQIAAGIRRRIADTLGLTCSVGVASTKFVAKVASARCKPDGLLLVPTADVLGFLHPLPVTVLWGVGARTADPLHRLGVRTIGDLADVPSDTLGRAVGVAIADNLIALAAGRDARPVHERDAEKSISVDHTAAVDLTTAADVRGELLRLSEEISRRVRARGLAARTVGIKIRFADFRTVTRVRTLPDWVDSGASIFAAALDLYLGLRLDRPRIRLVGVKCENLLDVAGASRQLTLDIDAGLPARMDRGLLGDGARRDEEASDAGARTRVPARTLDQVSDATRDRFGSRALRPAALVRRPPAAPSSTALRPDARSGSVTGTSRDAEQLSRE